MSGQTAIEPAETQVREVDPFSFFGAYASALPGYGGAGVPHDPRYCLHTHYFYLTPGRARFRLRLNAVRVSRGELTIRIHAFRDGEDSEVGITAGAKLDLAEYDGTTIDRVLRFTALEGLKYAMFAFFTEPSDLTAEAVQVTLEEMGDRVAIPANLSAETRSQLARSAYATSHRLVTPTAPSLELPMSQALVGNEGEVAAAARWPALAAAEPNLQRRREAVAVLRALDLGGTGSAGAHGLLVDPPSRALGEELTRLRAVIDRLMLSATHDDDVDTGHYGAARDGAYDFVVSYAMAGAGPTAEERLRVVGAGLRALRGSGIGLFLLPFWTGTAHQPTPSTEYLDRNAVQQIALRLIGQRYSVSQLSFPPSTRRGGEAASFILIVHKLA